MRIKLKLKGLSPIRIKTDVLTVYQLLRSKFEFGVGMKAAFAQLRVRIKMRLGIGAGAQGHARAKKRLSDIEFGIGTDLHSNPSLTKGAKSQLGFGATMRAAGAARKTIRDQRLGVGAGVRSACSAVKSVGTQMGIGASMLRTRCVLMHKTALKRLGIGAGMQTKNNLRKAVQYDAEFGVGADFTTATVRKRAEERSGAGFGVRAYAGQKIALSPVRFGTGCGMGASAVAAQLTKLGELDGFAFADLDSQTLEQLTYRIIE